MNFAAYCAEPVARPPLSIRRFDEPTLQRFGVVKRVSAPAAGMLRHLIRQQDAIVRSLLTLPSLYFYEKAVGDAFEEWAKLRMAADSLLSTELKGSALARETRMALSEVRSRVAEYGAARLGAEVAQEFDFQLATAARAFHLVTLVNAAELPADKESVDAELRTDFRVCALWSIFHHQQLWMVVVDESLNPPAEILQHIAELGRVVLRLYATVREGAELRGLFARDEGEDAPSEIEEFEEF